MAEREQPVLPVPRFRQQRSTRSLALSLSMRLSLSLSLSLPEPVVARAGRARNLLPRVRQSAAPARIGRGGARRPTILPSARGLHLSAVAYLCRPLSCHGIYHGECRPS